MRTGLDQTMAWLIAVVCTVVLFGGGLFLVFKIADSATGDAMTAASYGVDAGGDVEGSQSGEDGPDVVHADEPENGHSETISAGHESEDQQGAGDSGGTHSHAEASHHEDHGK